MVGVVPAASERGTPGEEKECAGASAGGNQSSTTSTVAAGTARDLLCYF